MKNNLDLLRDINNLRVSLRNTFSTHIKNMNFSRDYENGDVWGSFFANHYDLFVNHILNRFLNERLPDINNVLNYIDDLDKLAEIHNSLTDLVSKMCFNFVNDYCSGYRWRGIYDEGDFGDDINDEGNNIGYRMDIYDVIRIDGDNLYYVYER